MFENKDKLKYKEKNLIKKLKSNKIYYFIIPIIIFLFSPKKTFIVTSKEKFKRAAGIISYSVYNFFNIKIGYIDDFIVSRRLRGKRVGKKLFTIAEEKIKERKCKYSILISDKKRIESHNLYKRAGYTILNAGLFILAYKKIKNKK